MKATGLLFFLCFSYHISSAQNAYWQQQANYSINVALNEKAHTLDGSETIEYINNSPDTLYFLWIHLWANAYKNDRTAFSEQQLDNGSTNFYFSNEEDKGYINQLAFKVNGSIVIKEDHPKHQDIVKIVLPSPLAPKQKCTIQTPFHVKLPYNFSRGGHIGQSYQVTQWYPKIAVYDRKGWHEMPYLDQGEFYSDFGNYEVRITLPANYIVAATGEMTGEERPKSFLVNKGSAADNANSPQIKTVTYKQDNVIDFAWFADKNFTVKKDTLALPSGRIINVAAYTLPVTGKSDSWSNAVLYIKKTIVNRSKLIGEYPYNTVSVVQGGMKYSGGMEYPTITVLSGQGSASDVESTIEHEVGHNWFYGILATNERDHAWMDEGMNTYYENFRYKMETKAPPLKNKKDKTTFLSDRTPEDLEEFLLHWAATERKDQPIETPSQQLSLINYQLSAYYKPSRWMQQLQYMLGERVFDSCMREYYRQWKFKHPYPEDFKVVIESVSGKNLDTVFSELQQTGGSISTSIDLRYSLDEKNVGKRPVKFASFFSFRNTSKYKYIFAAPGIGYNYYDKFMIGAVLHNYTLPAEKFQFLVAPLYGTGSKALNGIVKFNYHWFPNNNSIHKVEVGINGSSFSINHSFDTTGNKIFERFRKAVPYVRVYLKESPLSHAEHYFDFRTYIIHEKFFTDYGYVAGRDSSLYPKSFTVATRYVNQLTYRVNNYRVLYPYSYQLQLQQGEGFYRINAEADYFFNYAKGGGLSARLFAAKFGYIGSRNSNTYLYQPQLMGANGDADYLYNNYFLGRSASNGNASTLIKNAGIAAQQVMTANTGGLHFRLDESVGGISDTWVAAINLSSSLPEKLFPVKIPLRLYFDAGTYASVWKKGNTQNRFIYVGGLQLSLFKNVLNIYAPLIYSNEFKDYLNTDKNANKFTRKITFSIDLENLRLRKLFPQLTM